MDERFKKLTEKLSDHISTESCSFLAKNLNKEENIGKILDLIISSHITSLSNLMNYVSDNDEISRNLVKNFIDNLYDHIKSSHPIVDMEMVKSSDIQ